MYVQTAALSKIDSSKIIILMDNSVDFLSQYEKRKVKKVHEWIKEVKDEKWIDKRFKFPFAEHGFSALICTEKHGENYCVLFDTGVSEKGVLRNAEGMGVTLTR